MRTFRPALAAVLCAASVLLACPSGSSAESLPPSAMATPVVLVHGAALGACPGLDVNQTWRGLALLLRWARWAGPIDTVGYYACDRDFTTRVGSFDDATPVPVVAQALAWYLWHRYSARGQAVDVVAHSMGGLVMRWITYRVAARDPAFPPSLDLARVITISTPHAGVGRTADWQAVCGPGALQCQDFGTDSAFVRTLQAHPEFGGAAWTVIGSLACDIVPARSAVALPGARTVVYTSPCYGHTAYLSDLSLGYTATTTAGGRKPRALAAVVILLASAP